jgi:protein-S-isoprenylcysteine O-methyltransferase Ste14/ubiquinone biosynthesis protein UbiJ
MIVKIKISHGLLLLLLAIIFTTGLTFVSVELPQLLDSFLHKKVDFPSIVTGLNESSDLKTELYLQHYHLRLIGYLCFIFTIILIVVGFITNKSGLSSAGAIALFLPIFGHFAMTMFFLGGLGFMRLIWLPFLDVSFDVLSFGDIVHIPYIVLLWILSLFNINIWYQLPFVITGIGLFFFILGTLTWFYTKIQKKGVADFWVYRISRHPQYLGWIIWSYGVMLLPVGKAKICYDLSNSLPWLLATMVIISIAMLEELKMRREQGEEYELYCSQTPFLLPLPHFVSKIVSFPMQLIVKKRYPDRKREIAAVITLYTVICIVLSVCYVNFSSLSKIKSHIFTMNTGQNVEELVKVIKETDDWSDKYNAAMSLGEIGEPAVQQLIQLSKDEIDVVREYSVRALGKIQSKKAVQPLIEALQDKNRNVRIQAVSALGEIRSEEAVQPLIQALSDEKIRYWVAEALGKIGSEEAVDSLVAGLKDNPWHIQRSYIIALGIIKSERAIEPLMDLMNDGHLNVRCAVVLALMNIGSKRAVKPLIKALNDEDGEVRIYAVEALKRISTPEALEAVKNYKRRK